MKPELLISRVFGIQPARVTEAGSNTTIPEWDSLGHVTLISELESVYRIQLSAEEALRLTSVPAIKEALEDRGIRW